MVRKSIILFLVALTIVLPVVAKILQKSKLSPDISPITQVQPSITKNVYVINFDPYISGTTPLSTFYNWNNFQTLDTTYIADVKAVSHGYLNYNIVKTVTIRDYPVKPG